MGGGGRSELEAGCEERSEGVAGEGGELEDQAKDDVMEEGRSEGEESEEVEGEGLEGEGDMLDGCSASGDHVGNASYQDEDEIEDEESGAGESCPSEVQPAKRK